MGDHLIGERIREARTMMGWTKAELARALGVRPSQVGEWEASKYEPSARHLERLAEILKVNVNWLLTESKPMSGDPLRSALNELVRDGLKGEKLSRGFTQLLEKARAEKLKSLGVKVKRKLLLEGAAHAGERETGVALTGETGEQFPASSKNARWVRIVGDCAEPFIPSGTYVLVDPDVGVASGDIVLVLEDDTPKILRVVFNSNAALMFPLNPKYPPRSLNRRTLADGDAVILGKVVFWGRRI